MFEKILIANRGEIACRVIRTARRMGIRTVAVYSDADADALHVKMADEAVRLGPAPSSESYLRADRVIEAAHKTGAQAIHPGYGFLSENAEFCKACADAGLVFIGPPASAITAMGSKSAAKTIMGEAGVPLVPGYHGKDQSRDVLKAAADEMGYPVLLKAVAGGGGKGMRQVWQANEFDEALAAAKREAKAGFGNDHMLVEKYLTKPRHVEVQVFCDQHRNGVYLFERDCSVQRRHQKIIEEAPAPGISDDLRSQMGDAALRAAQAIDYVGAGTVEFLLDVDGSFYFMEMNTRLQVEHPVTEMITGQDLVEWQLRVANGETLPLAQADLQIRGHAFEARVYAEDPDNEFLPATGHLAFLQPPSESSNVRVDTGVVQGDSVSVYYDPMIAKLVVWGEHRDRALHRLTQALYQYRIVGVTTNVNFLIRLAESAPFRAAEVDTGFIANHEDSLFDVREVSKPALVAAAIGQLLMKRQQRRAKSADVSSPWNLTDDWRANSSSRTTECFRADSSEVQAHIERTTAGFQVTIAEESHAVTARLSDDRLSVSMNGHQVEYQLVAHAGLMSLFWDHGRLDIEPVQPLLDDDTGVDSDQFCAPMNGTVVKVAVKPGDNVEEGATLIIIEAMKMEHSIRAPASGVVSEVFYAEGDLVDGGAVLLSFELER